MTLPDAALATPAEVAAALIGAPIDAIEPVRGFGRNSRVYRVAQGGSLFALKHYPSTAGDAAQDRLRVELGALGLMIRHGITCVPRALAADERRGYALLEWIAGKAVGESGAADINAAAEFIAAVHALRGSEAAKAQPFAAEACLSAGEIVAQIERRAARLMAAAADEQALDAFLVNSVQPLLRAIVSWAEAKCRAHRMQFALPITSKSRTLCPSDFGFHNALRTPSGRLFFIDFDYFGWDDPVKLTCDFLLHPGMQLSAAEKRDFAAAAMRIYGDDPEFRLRLPLLYPLFALRWCLILLNEFLPERWASRVHAGVESEWAAAKRRQLDRAVERVQSLTSNFRRFPYGE